MKYIYCPIMPLDVEQVKDSDATTPINGGHVAERALVENILRFSRQNTFLFPRRPLAPLGDLRKIPHFTDGGERVRFVNTQELLAGALSRDILLFSPAWAMDHLLALRHSIGRQSIPLVSVSHSLCSPGVMSHMTMLCLDGLWAHDALVVPSSAGLEALRKMWVFAAKRVGAGTKEEELQNPEFRVIPHGIDDEYFGAVGSREVADVTFLYFGRFSTQSKADLVPLLLAWKALKKRVRAAYLVIAGDDTQQGSAKRLRAVAEHLGCSASVRIIENPTKSQKLEMYRAADVFVSPSDSLQETFGLTLLEAMGAGLPVIASDWSGYKDIVDDSTGFLIPTLFPAMPPADSHDFSEPFLSDISAAATSVNVDCLTDRMVLLANSKELRRNLGEAGRQKAAAQFSWKRVVNMYDDLWDRVGEEGRRFQLSHTGTARAKGISPATVFSHYSTSNLRDELRVRRSGHEDEKDLTNLACDGYPSPKGLMATYRATTIKPTTVRVLTELLRESDKLSRREVFLHVGRLIKYNIICYD